jgi:ABC-2 type transport system ATP-binding protein
VLAPAVRSGETAVIELNGLTKRYGAARGIEELSLTVVAGEVFGFLGPNGAGKTTTIRTLLDLLHPTSGTARLFGLDSRRDARAIHARLGNLPGEFAYDRRLSGRELLAFLADLRGLHGLGRAPELAERFEADLDRPLGALSRGNRQKIGLIQAAFHEPELLVLDEPTSGLDPLMQEAFIRDGRLAAVEDVAAITARSYRRVALEFAMAVDPAEFARLPGVSDLVADGRRIAFKASDGLDGIVKAAARHELTDIELVHPTLEEVFLTYYGAAG